MPREPQEMPPIQSLVDEAKTLAFQRGADKPDWNDIWLSMLNNSDYALILRKRGVEVDNLRTDLRYESRLQAHQRTTNKNLSEGSIVEEIKKDLLTDIENFSAAFLENNQVHGNEALQRAIKENLGKFLGYIAINASRRMADINPNPMHQNIKIQIVHKIMETVHERLELDRNQQALLSNLMEDVVGFGLRAVDANDPASLLEALSQEKNSVYSDLQIVNAIIDLSGSFYKKLLIRNGEYINDYSYEDDLSNVYPGRNTQRLILSALDLAYKQKSRSLEQKHIVLTLISNPEVRRHLTEIGVVDLQKFEDKYEYIAFEQERGRTSEIKTHPNIREFSDKYLNEINDFCNAHQNDDFLFSKLLRHLIDNNKELEKALQNSGITRKMLRAWGSPYKEKDLKLELKTPDKKQKLDFKVSDTELENLIAEYCVDYTQLAAQKKFDPLIGNEAVIEEVSTSFLKKGKKNPMIIGEPGIGKTKIIEGFSTRVVKGQVPKKLIGARVLMIDISAMESPFAGVFTTRLKELLDGISERNAAGKTPPIIVAIDEFANAMEAGSHSKSDGAQELLKPYLTSGNLYTLSTTTLEEFQRKVQKNVALARRMNPIQMSPPTDKETALILRGLKSAYTKHHGLTIQSDILDYVADMAGRYIHQVNQPDKSIDLFDNACAIAVAEGARSLMKKHVIKATSKASNVPESFLSSADNIRYAKLPDSLNAHVIEQPKAVNTVASAIQRSKAGLNDPDKPAGNFIFLGPTGVGKTELAKALAMNLFGTLDNLLRYDMSEYQEKHQVSRFTGAPPGYVGYEEGGGLVNAVRAKPYSVVLLDEIEKAHPDIYDVLLGPFDNGILTDGRGVSANLRHTINIMTSNIGANAVWKEGEKQGLDPLEDATSWNEMAFPIYMEAVQKFFKPEFLNRIDAVVCFNSLSKNAIGTLVDREILQTQNKLKTGQFNLDIELSTVFREHAIRKGYDVRLGARPLKRAWNDIMVTPLSQWLLSQSDRKIKKANKVIVTCSNSDIPTFALSV